MNRQICQLVARVGPSGAGKTTLLKLILQLLQPGAGQVYRRNQPPLSVAYEPQLETVDWNFPVTAEEVVLMGITQRSGWWPWPRHVDRKRARGIVGNWRSSTWRKGIFVSYQAGNNSASFWRERC